MLAILKWFLLFDAHPFVICAWQDLTLFSGGTTGKLKIERYLVVWACWVLLSRNDTTTSHYQNSQHDTLLCCYRNIVWSRFANIAESSNALSFFTPDLWIEV